MAMNADNPKPSAKFETVPPETMGKMKSTLRAEGKYGLAWSCEGPVGFYTLLKFLVREDERQLAQFLLECCRYRDIPIESERRKCGEEIVTKFIMPRMQKRRSSRASFKIAGARKSSQSARIGSETTLDSPGKRRSSSLTKAVTVEHVVPFEISESDLIRHPNPADSSTVDKYYATHCEAFEALPPEGDMIPIDLTIPPSEGMDGCVQWVGNEGKVHAFDVVEAMAFKYAETRYWEQYEATPVFARVMQFEYLQHQDAKDSDFTQFRILGKGGFGLVYGCRKNTTGTMYAMKTMGKARVKKKKSEQLCINERMALNEANSPFVVCLKYAFANDQDLYLIIDLMMGGDLNYWLNEKHTFSKSEARYYSARTLLGIQHLHSLGLVYRDLKPENILMDEMGRTRISDLGLACKVTPDLKGTCGTRGYMAPEMLKRDEEGHRLCYGVTVDWFSFGCVVYEFIHGKSPFRSHKAKHFKAKGAEGDADDAGDDEETKKRKSKDAKLKKQKSKGKGELDPISLATLEMEIEYNDDAFDAPTKAFCARLLERDPAKRLGANGGEEIMEDPWYTEHLKWPMIIHDLEEPPFKAGKDIHAAAASEIGEFEPTEDVKLEKADHDIYNKWNHISSVAFQCEAVEFLKMEEKDAADKEKARISKLEKRNSSSGGGCIIL